MPAVRERRHRYSSADSYGFYLLHFIADEMEVDDPAGVECERLGGAHVLLVISGSGGSGVKQ